MTLTPVMEKFVLHWGEMGTKWGVNRTVAQIHALLYVAGRAMPAEEIAETLSVARSNVSTSLRELLGWGIVRVVSVLGDRRDHYEALGDVWETYRVVMDERKRRELDPTLRVLAECVQAAQAGGTAEAEVGRRLGELLSFLEGAAKWYEQVRKLPVPVLKRMLKLGGGVRNLLIG